MLGPGRTNIILWDKDCVPTQGAVVKFNLVDEGTVLLVRERCHGMFLRFQTRGVRVVAVHGGTFDRLISRLHDSRSEPIYVRVVENGTVIIATSLHRRAFDSFIGDQHHLDSALGGVYKGRIGGGHVFGSKIRIYQGAHPLHDCVLEAEAATPQLSFAVSIYAPLPFDFLFCTPYNVYFLHSLCLIGWSQSVRVFRNYWFGCNSFPFRFYRRLWWVDFNWLSLVGLSLTGLGVQLSCSQYVNVRFSEPRLGKLMKILGRKWRSCLLHPCSHLFLVTVRRWMLKPFGRLFVSFIPSVKHL